MTLAQETASENARGCAGWVVFGVVLAVLLSLLIIPLLVGWGLEQALFDGSLPLPDVRWLSTLSFGGLVMGVCALGLLFKARRSRAIYRTWLWAGAVSVALTPARLAGLTDAYLINVLQIGGLLVCLLALTWVVRRNGLHTRWRGLAWALVMAALQAPSLVARGALGSPLDTALNLLVALLFGAVFALNLFTNLLRVTQPEGEPYPAGRFWLDGLVAMVTLLIMVAGLGQSGNQWTLATAIPILGWAAVALSRYGINDSGGHNWPVPAVLIAVPLAVVLCWVDADEMAGVATSGEGELIAVVGRVVLGMLLSGLVVSLLLGLVHKSLAEARFPAWTSWAVAALCFVGLGLVYFSWGQPGFYGERLFVILKDQADLSAAQQIEAAPERRAYVYHTLTAHASRTQQELRAELDRRGGAYQPYYLINALEVQGGPLLRAWLESRPEVERVLDSPVLRPLPEQPPVQSGYINEVDETLWNQKMIGADRVWRELHVTGAGVVVGQSDTGVEGDHPELADSYRGANGQNDYNWFDPWYHSAAPVDIGGHGTHTLGTVLGNRVGMAPDATWIGCVNLARNLGNPALYLDCMQFHLAPFPQAGDPFVDGDPGRGANVLNNSWGCPPVEGCDPGALLYAVRALRTAGVFVVASAGNTGTRGCGSVSDPIALYAEVFSVGAVDQGENLVSFSSLGPVTADGSGRTKPDILAPGAGVVSAYPGKSYDAASGTSMAGPHVAGVVALMWSANPKLIGDIEQTEEILRRTAQPYKGYFPDCVTGRGTPNDAAGYGIVDAYAAVKAALAVQQ